MKSARFFRDNYYSDLAEGNILRSPGEATIEDVKGVAPAFVVTAEADILHDGKYK